MTNNPATESTSVQGARESPDPSQTVLKPSEVSQPALSPVINSEAHPPPGARVLIKVIKSVKTGMRARVTFLIKRE